ncbi:MAG: alpha-glucan family phosphorylase [Kiritimatiellae bacterium]|nr:alpha-glucan family phosphorylase [Kiritimatiellia bacterium]
MTNFKTYTVSPKIPENLSFLETLARNVWWCWNTDASALFRRVSPTLFRELEFNPVRLVSRVGQARLEELSADPSFLAHLASVEAQFRKEVLQSKHWSDPDDTNRRVIAYFSMEFGLHESIHIYSGGLGILAGDHLKSASDLDIPLVGIGLFYREGYFEQEINASGWQVEGYPENDVHGLPVGRCLGADGKPLLLEVPLAGGPLKFTAWKLRVGRIPLILLDTNIPENPPELRGVTGQLYGGDKLNRLRQEVLLGVGGLRAAEALGYEVACSHMNEGHAAFLGPERIAKTMKRRGLAFDEAKAFVRRTSVFTTHTPVPAGNETFDLSLLWPQLVAFEKEGGLPAETVKALGRAPGDKSDELSMTVLGLACSLFNNGVAKLHGVVERDMWHHLWPEFPVDEVPIGHVTNGIHVPTWISTDNSQLYAGVLGPDWDKAPVSPAQAARIDHIQDEELWRVHEAARAHLVRSAREILERSARRRRDSAAEVEACRNVLDKDALTIGFARRFATYKRATLLLSDPERLKRLLSDDAHPVQIVFAGKAHPADNGGKQLIQRIVEFSRDPAVKGRIVFLENYNMHIARRMVRGVDVWLNTPRRPMEASGTSGMKACVNGAIHVSTLDGWWPEGYSPRCGWQIGDGQEFADEGQQNWNDAQSLYNLLENEIVPAFYDRPHGELPLRWISMMKESIKMSIPGFSSSRMVSDYFRGSYSPALSNYDALSGDGFASIREDIARRNALYDKWGGVRVEALETDRDISAHNVVGDSFEVSAKVRLEGVDPSDVRVELYLGSPDAQGAIRGATALPMEPVKRLSPSLHLYKLRVPCENTGAFAFTARVVPASDAWRTSMPGYVRWA